ncbi:MAG: hypothetical protein L0219_04965 [Phycisphaerales bacterium]|nr:hypothetical protein [Phycisphaerales bacterium]MCI0675614.1 hypothetical protein [Phycisphaerales bacterium]
MKRRLRNLALFVLVGAIVNIAVAWTCAIAINVRSAAIEYGVNPTWEVNAQRRIGALLVESYRRRGIEGEPGDVAASSLVPSWLPIARATPEWTSLRAKVEQRVLDCRGWPMLSMYCELEKRFYSAELGQRKSPLHEGLPTDLAPFTSSAPIGPVQVGRRANSFREPPLSFVSGSRVLPLGLIPIGFAGNTIFYATMFWLLLAAPKGFRGWRRARRGLCAACGYPVNHGVSDVCTECGEPVKA